MRFVHKPPFLDTCCYHPSSNKPLFTANANHGWTQCREQHFMVSPGLTATSTSQLLQRWLRNPVKEGVKGCESLNTSGLAISQLLWQNTRTKANIFSNKTASPNSFQTGQPTGDQVFKHVSVGVILIQTTIAWKSPVKWFLLEMVATTRLEQ